MLPFFSKIFLVVLFVRCETYNCGILNIKSISSSNIICLPTGSLFFDLFKINFVLFYIKVFYLPYLISRYEYRCLTESIHGSSFIESNCAGGGSSFKTE